MKRLMNNSIARQRISFIALAFSLTFIEHAPVYAQGTSFTYQGKLTDGGNVANGQYDVQSGEPLNTGDTVLSRV